MNPPRSLVRCLVTILVAALLSVAAPARAAETTFRDNADRTGTIDLRTITMTTTKKKLRVDLEMFGKIKPALIRDNQAGINVNFETDETVQVAYVVDPVGSVSLEVCSGRLGCVERKGTLEGKHARFAMPLKQVKDGKFVRFSVLTVVFGGFNQCPVRAGTCPDRYPNNGSLEELRVR